MNSLNQAQLPQKSKMEWTDRAGFLSVGLFDALTKYSVDSIHFLMSPQFLGDLPKAKVKKGETIELIRLHAVGNHFKNTPNTSGEVFNQLSQHFYPILRRQVKSNWRSGRYLSAP